MNNTEILTNLTNITASLTDITSANTSVVSKLADVTVALTALATNMSVPAPADVAPFDVATVAVATKPKAKAAGKAKASRKVNTEGMTLANVDATLKTLQTKFADDKALAKAFRYTNTSLRKDGILAFSKLAKAKKVEDDSPIAKAIDAYKLLADIADGACTGSADDVRSQLYRFRHAIANVAAA